MAVSLSRQELGGVRHARPALGVGDWVRPPVLTEPTRLGETTYGYKWNGAECAGQLL